MDSKVGLPEAKCPRKLIRLLGQNRFAHQPEIYKQFLEILQTYQRESKPIQDVYAQVTELFNTAPDLLEDFNQFLPESAAQAKAQAAARAAAEDAMTVSNVRDNSAYPDNRIAQARTPRSVVKMPNAIRADFYGEPIPAINTMFMNWTISEDRTGTEEEIMVHRLAAFGARCEGKKDWRKIR